MNSNLYSRENTTGFSSRLGEEEIKELENKAMELIQTEQQKEKKEFLKMKTTERISVATSSRITFSLKGLRRRKEKEKDRRLI